VSEFLQQLVNGLTSGSVYALIALGYTMVYGILRLINFAHGDVYMLGAFFGLFAARALAAGSSPSPLKALAVLCAAMIGCGIVGVIIERGAYKPVRKSPRLSALITAIGVSLLLENGGRWCSAPTRRSSRRSSRSTTSRSAAASRSRTSSSSSWWCR
jgi:branched-chain amino acid transport system permease protein